MSLAVARFAELLLAPIVYTLLTPNRIRKSRAARTIHDYLQNLNRTNLLSALSSSLAYAFPSEADGRYAEQVFDKFAAGNAPRWDLACFTHFVHAQYGDADILEPTIPLLWRCFASAADFPLPYKSESIDKEGFLRAYALLVLQGIQIFGTRRDGSSPDWDGFGSGDYNYESKVNRISRFMYSCLAREGQKDDASGSEDESVSKKNSESQRCSEDENARDQVVQNVYDSIYFAQPLTDQYMEYSCAIPYDPLVRKEHFCDASRRLVEFGDEVIAARWVWKADLRSFLELLLLVCVRKTVWKEGLNGYSSQRSADVQYSYLDVSSEESERTAELAGILLAVLFGPDGEEGSIPFAAFERCCGDCPAFVFLFFQTWASIFAPISQSTKKERSGSTITMSTSLINCCSLLQIAKFDDPSPRARYFGHELALNLDLRASSMVFDTTDLASRDRVTLEKVLATGDHFHVMVLELDPSDVAPSEGKSTLQVLFIAPEDPRMEMKSPDPMVSGSESKGGFASYVWKSSVMRLLPKLIKVDAGRVAVDGSVTERGLMLRSYDDGDSGETIVRLDMEDRSCSISGFGDARKRGLISLQVYRMPGKAHVTTRKGGGWDGQRQSLFHYQRRDFVGGRYIEKGKEKP